MTRRTFLAVPVFAVSGSGIHWIVSDLKGTIQSSNWPESQTAIGMGSMLKPFLALAYLSTHSTAPTITCYGARSACWLPNGHGRQDLVAALANSCNTYFLQIARELNPAALDRICLQFGLLPPARDWEPSRLIGIRSGWPQTPDRVVRSFALLSRDRTLPGSDRVLAGMRQCARTGTGRLVGLRCYVKTGTGACCHFPTGAGDGYATVLYPLDSPRHVLLMQAHNSTGAHTAGRAKILLQVFG